MMARRATQLPLTLLGDEDDEQSEESDDDAIFSGTTCVVTLFN